MRRDTRIELTVLIVIAVVVGVWVGLRLTREKEPTQHRTEIAVSSDPETPAPPMTAPPAATPLKVESANAQEQPSGDQDLLPAVIPQKEAQEPEQTAVIRQPEPQPDPLSDQAKQLIGGGRWYEARKLLTKQILAMPNGPQREKLRSILQEINQVLFFSREPSPDCIFHEVQRGDSLARIATRVCKRDYYFHTVIMRVNGIHDPNKVRLGQKLKLPRGTFSARVERGAHRLIILFNGDYIKEYPITVGARETPTPLGKFVLANDKMVKPDWTAPDGHVYKYGDPKNILGTRWLGFQETAEHAGFGIHGTTDPKSIGKDLSNGCIRMLNKDVEEIFGMLMPGEIVEVVE